MANPSLDLILAIRSAAYKLEISACYQWGHMGACNCGFLAQEITRLTKEEIHRRAMMRFGDWSEQLNDYCPTSHLLMDDVISELIAFGFDISDLRQLEQLSDPKILAALPPAKRNLKFNLKPDVITYMKVWARLLEDELVKNVTIPAFKMSASEVKFVSVG